MEIIFAERFGMYSYRSVLSELPKACQHLLALLFGTWFRIVNHSEYNSMSSEAVAKSVAGSLFHTCSDDPKKVEKAVDVLKVGDLFFFLLKYIYIYIYVFLTILCDVHHRS